MANKKNWLGMLVTVLTFGLTVLGCASAPVISSDGLFEYVGNQFTKISIGASACADNQLSKVTIPSAGGKASRSSGPLGFSITKGITTIGESAVVEGEFE